MTVERLSGRSERMVVRGSACEAASCTWRDGTPASWAVMNEWRGLCGEIRLVIPARLAQPSHRPIRLVAVDRGAVDARIIGLAVASWAESAADASRSETARE